MTKLVYYTLGQIASASFESQRLFYLILLFSMWTCSPLAAQGLLLDDDLYESQNKFPVYDEGNKSELEALAGIDKIDLRPFCPEPQDQGFISSCTGWACGYGAMTILQAINKGWSGQKDVITQNAFSSLFVYNQIKKGSCDFGAYMTDAAILIRDKGDVLSKNFDKIKNKCDRAPSEQELKDALPFRIKDFVSVFSNSDPTEVKIQRTKLSLAQKKPVVIGISLLKNFQNLPEGSLYWYPTIGDTTTIGGHSLVVIGFDNGREAFEVMNSWGPNWGNQGFIWIKYKDFGKYSHYGYVFIPTNDNFRFVDITASLILQSPFYSDDNALGFEPIPVVRKGGYYEMTKSLSKKGDLIQPLILEVRKDSYLYIFSIDAKNEVHVHWPRDGRLDSQFEGNHESAIIAVSHVNLSIPGKYSALSLGNVGTEYWCFLISGKPLSRLNEDLKQLKLNSNLDFNYRLQNIFGAHLLSPGRIKYSSDKIQAESDMNPDGIVPLVVKIKIAGT